MKLLTVAPLFFFVICLLDASVNVAALLPVPMIPVATTHMTNHHSSTSIVVAASDDTSVDLNRLKRGEQQVASLLENWKTRTTYCNFGEFNNELLSPENKQKLMVEAAAGGLLDYDKSATMNIKCKRDPQIVRSYVGYELCCAIVLQSLFTCL